MIFLNQFGFGFQLFMKIYQVYEFEMFEKIQENFYQFVKDVEGIGFGKVDEFGSRMGFLGNYFEWIKVVILYMFEMICLLEGYMYIEMEQLIIDI